LNHGIKTNTPKGAFYIFPDISYYFGKKIGTHLIQNSNDFCMYLLNDAHVALVSGAISCEFSNLQCGIDGLLSLYKKYPLLLKVQQYRKHFLEDLQCHQ